MEFLGFDLDMARKYLERALPFAETTKPFEREMRRFLEVTRERLQQNLGPERWSQLTVRGDLFEVGLTEWGGAWQGFTDVRMNRLPAASHCIWWGFYAAPGSGELFAYWGIEPRSERVLAQFGAAFEDMAKRLKLEVRKLRPDLAMYWGRVGGVSLAHWKDLQTLLLDRAGKLLTELTDIAVPEG